MKSIKLSAVLLLVALFFSCQKKDTQAIIEENSTQLEKYKEYISDISSGVISKYDPIYVVLQTPIQGWSDNQELSKDILEISPSVKGKLIAVNNRTISFIPEDSFEGNTTYTVELDLDELIEDLEKGLDDTFVFAVETMKQQFSLNTENLQSYSKDWQYIEGNIATSDKMKFETAKQLLTVTQDGKQVPIKFGESLTLSRNFSFRIDSIQRLVDDSEIELKWSGKPFNIELSLIHI